MKKLLSIFSITLCILFIISCSNKTNTEEQWNNIQKVTQKIEHKLYRNNIYSLNLDKIKSLDNDERKELRKELDNMIYNVNKVKVSDKQIKKYKENIITALKIKKREITGDATVKELIQYSNAVKNMHKLEKIFKEEY